MRGKRGKKNYTREEVWEIIEEIHDELIERLREFILGENGLTEEDVDSYFNNYEL